IAIGFTVIVALGILVVMILIFAGIPEALTGGTKIIIHAPHTGNLHKGDKIYLRGMRIGEITDVEFTQDNPTMGVTITGIIDNGICLPKNTLVSVETQGLTSMANLAVWPGNDDGRGFYKKGEVVVIDGIGQSGSSLIPKEVSDAMTDFAKLARSLNELVSGAATSQPAAISTTQNAATTTAPAIASTQPSADRPGLAGTVARLNRTLDSIYSVSGNAQTQENIRQAIANLKVATDQMKTLLATADNLSRELITDAEQTGKLLKSFQKAVDSLNEGNGTAGKLLNDPQVYNNLVEVTVELQGLIKDLRRLSDQWERNGVGVKLK
ncbi:MAG TPA: MlaD family protein, partial [Phycisphaerae bacterium]|nr:MlaD family protein [Phycisphaerae bacterium]